MKAPFLLRRASKISGTLQLRYATTGWAPHRQPGPSSSAMYVTSWSSYNTSGITNNMQCTLARDPNAGSTNSVGLPNQRSYDGDLWSYQVCNPFPSLPRPLPFHTHSVLFCVVVTRLKLNINFFVLKCLNWMRPQQWCFQRSWYNCRAVLTGSRSRHLLWPVSIGS